MGFTFNDPFFNALFPYNEVKYTESKFPFFNLIKDTENQCFIIELSLAGWNKDELDVTVDGGSLVIKGTPKKEERLESLQYITRNISKRAWARSWRLGDGLDVDKTSVSFNDGILRIRLPFIEKDALRLAIL